MIRGKLKNTKSLLIIVQQERANVGGDVSKETITSGGKALFIILPSSLDEEN